MGIGKLRTTEDNKLCFYCPGCEYNHYFNETWQWNGSYDKPTVTPSILVHGRFRCHLYLTDGKIQYLTDCEHHLAGQTVEMIEEE